MVRSVTRTGDSKWISSEASRRLVHELRGRMDAIVVGIGTVLADDPLLTVRPPGPRTPTRIVLDSRGRTPPTGRLVTTAREVPLIVAATHGVDSREQAEFQALGCELLLLPSVDARPSVTALLEALGQRRLTNILIEGGSAVLGSFLDTRAIDEVHVLCAPRLAGGVQAKTPIGGLGVEKIADSLALREWQVQTGGQRRLPARLALSGKKYQ